MTRRLLILYRGGFGRRAAERAATLADAVAVDLADAAAAKSAVADLRAGDRALVLLSDTLTPPVEPLAETLRLKGVRWTSAYVAPTLVRVGPLTDSDGTCFNCATHRYLSAPGGSGLARFEKYVHSGAAGPSVEFDGYPATVVEMVVAEALRQIEDEDMPTGFMRKLSLLDFDVTDAVALPVHGCECAGVQGEPGDRFHQRLLTELADVFERVES